MISLPFYFKPFTLCDKNENLFIKHPGAVVILMVDSFGRIAIVAQHRPIIDNITLELPAGKIEEGESVEDAVFREAIEETGYEAINIKKLLSFYPDQTLTDELLTVYICEKGQKVGQDLDADEFISPFFLSLRDIIQLVKENKIIDIKTLIAIAFAYIQDEVEINSSISDEISYNEEYLINRVKDRTLVIPPNFYKTQFVMPNGLECEKYYLRADNVSISFSIKDKQFILRRGAEGEFIGSFYPSFALTDKALDIYIKGSLMKAKNVRM